MAITVSRRLGLAGAVLVLLLILGLGRVAAAGPRAHLADAMAPQSLAYHFTLLMAGTAADAPVDGQIAGVLDSQGVLTATLTTSEGLTTTVTGIVSASAGVTLTLRLHGAQLTLSGPTATTGRSSGSIAASVPAGAVGTWLLVPEVTTHTYTFDARVDTGRYRNPALGGKLVVALEAGKAVSHFDGTLTEDDGTTLFVTGVLVFGNMQLTIAGPGTGRIVGDAPMTRARGILGDIYTLYKGTFAGPGTGDRGIWTAAQEG